MDRNIPEHWLFLNVPNLFLHDKLLGCSLLLYIFCSSQFWKHYSSVLQCLALTSKISWLFYFRSPCPVMVDKLHVKIWLYPWKTDLAGICNLSEISDRLLLELSSLSRWRIEGRVWRLRSRNSSCNCLCPWRPGGDCGGPCYYCYCTAKLPSAVGCSRLSLVPESPVSIS